MDHRCEWGVPKADALHGFGRCDAPATKCLDGEVYVCDRCYVEATSKRETIDLTIDYDTTFDPAESEMMTTSFKKLAEDFNAIGVVTYEMNGKTYHTASFDTEIDDAAQFAAWLSRQTGMRVQLSAKKEPN